MFWGGGIQAFVSDDLTLSGNRLMTALTWLFGCVLFALQGLLIFLASVLTLHGRER